MLCSSNVSAKKLVGHSGVVGSIAIGCQGHLVATGAYRHQDVEGAVRIWRLPDGEPLGQIETNLNAIYGVVVSPDGQYLLAGGGGIVRELRWEYTGGIEVWNLDKKRQVKRFGKELLFVKSISYSPDGMSLLTSNSRNPEEGQGTEKYRVKLWRASDYKEIAAFGKHGGGIASACFSPDGRFVAFGSNKSGAGVELRSNAKMTIPYSLFRFLSNRKVDIQLHDANSLTSLIRIWSSISGWEEEPLGFAKGRIEGLAFSPDGHLLASSGSALTLWDFKKRIAAAELPQGPYGYSRCVDFSPSGTILASGGGYQSEAGSPYEDCGVKLWDRETTRLIAFLPHQTPVHSIRFSPDGTRIVAGGEMGELLMWNIESIYSGRTGSK
jgi:WD40 repeat protein